MTKFRSDVCMVRPFSAAPFFCRGYMSTHLPLSLRQIASALGGVVAGGQVLAPSPGHTAKDRGMAVKIDANAPGGFLVELHNGGDPIAAKDFIRTRLGLPPWQANGKGARPAATSLLSKEERTRIANERVVALLSKPDEAAAPRVVATYDYTDESGTLLYQVQRLEPKNFRQRAADGSWKLDGVRRVLFRLPELIAHESATVFLCEGEKDALRLVDLDLVATTISGGTSWTPEIAEPLRGRDVVIVPDHDAAGTKKAWQAASALHGVAASVRVVTLPGLSGKRGDKDVSDWLNADAARAGSLADICVAAPLWVPCPAPPDPVAEGDDAANDEPLVTVTPASWAGRSTPEMKWLAMHRIPVGDVTLLSADGGSGKTEVAVQLVVSVGHSLGDWLGCCIESGKAMMLSAEEDEADIWTRHDRFCKARGITDTATDQVHFHFPDLEATWLVTVDRAGNMAPTALFQKLKRWITEHRPTLVVIDANVAVFAGEHVQRFQVRSFVAMLRKIAREIGTAILLLDHPSVRGMSDGSGGSGSVDWSNAVRSRMYLRTDDDNPDVRHLEVMKINSWRPGEKVTLYWNGLTFGTQPCESISSADSNIEELFLRLLAERNAQGRYVHTSKAAGYAPKELAEMAGAKGVSARALAGAMERLMTSGKIEIVNAGPPSRVRPRLVVKKWL
jgi:RecA-family ATPase